jgi:hypothetical protein
MKELNRKKVLFKANNENKEHLNFALLSRLRLVRYIFFGTQT